MHFHFQCPLSHHIRGIIATECLALEQEVCSAEITDYVQHQVNHKCGNNSQASGENRSQLLFTNIYESILSNSPNNVYIANMVISFTGKLEAQSATGKNTVCSDEEQAKYNILRSFRCVCVGMKIPKQVQNKRIVHKSKLSCNAS